MRIAAHIEDAMTRMGGLLIIFSNFVRLSQVLEKGKRTKTVN